MMPLTKVVYIIYTLLCDTSYHQLFLFQFIADSTIARYKELLLACYERYLEQHPVVLGGPGIIVEVDESVISRRGIIRCPTSHDDIVLDTIWILGGIDRTDERNFFLLRVENRTAETLTEAMRYLILDGSILYTDGHASYPPTAETLGLRHHVVNHSEGFRASDGTHTNTIEGFWGHMKGTMRKENGVHRNAVDDWLIQYTFKRRYILGRSPEEFAEIFIAILKLFFELNC